MSVHAEPKAVAAPIQTKILFFAALREAVGSSEMLLPQLAPMQLSSLLTLLASQSSNIAAALTDREVLTAVNQQLVNQQAWVQPGDEVALFPPVTGG